MSKKYLGFTSYYDNEMQILFSSTNPFAFIAYVIIGGDSNPSIYITLANLPPFKMIYVQQIYQYRKNLKLKLLTYIFTEYTQIN